MQLFTKILSLLIGVFLFSIQTVQAQSTTAYYISPTGADTNPGTFDQPFKTIQKCASLVQAGNQCIIRGGTYRETITPSNDGAASQPIIFTSYQNEEVIIKGTQLISNQNWNYNSQTKIYSKQISSPSVQNLQLFVNNQMYNEARWPNSDLNIMQPSFATAGSDTTLNTLIANNLPSQNAHGSTIN